MSAHVFRHPARRGEHVTSYGPLSGSPRDAEGRLILQFNYGPKPPAPEKDFPE